MRRISTAPQLREENGDIVVVLPQVVLLEMTHVFFYGVPAGTVAEMIHAAIRVPVPLRSTSVRGERFSSAAPNSFSSVANAIIVALAITNRYDAIATFDQKMIQQ